VIRSLVTLLFLAGLANSSEAWELRRLPTPADLAKALADGRTSSRDSLASALLAAYQPGGPRRPGSTGVTAYRAWMHLWKWCDILSRSEREEGARLLAAHLRISAEHAKPVFYPPGIVPDPGTQALDVEQARLILADAPASAALLGQLLPADLIAPAERAIAEGLDQKIIVEWINDEELTRLLFAYLSEKDYLPGVLRRLQEIHLANGRKFSDYRGLAVALALVYDQAWPTFWPHHQVDHKLVPIAVTPVAERFNFWVESNEARALMLDLRKLSPDQIKYIVDAPLDPAEFRWARKNVKYQRSEFARAFDAVSYSQARVSAGVFDWRQGEYTLQNIRQQAGICVDQAYYAMIAGKAHGLPTLFFTGQGSQGGHAWFGYMKSDNRWEVNCGRDKNQNYAIGQALDPQTWLPISDHDLKFQANGLRNGLEYFSSRDDILVGRMSEAMGNGVNALRAYESAIQVCPENGSGWSAKADYLRRSKASLNVLKSHHQAAVQQFLTDRDMRVTHQLAIARIAREQGATQEAESLERQIIAQNKRRRSDLSVSVAAQKIITLVEARRFDEAFAEYRRQLTAIGRLGGGKFFYDIVQPYVEAVSAAGKQGQAKEALALARKALQPELGGILEGDLSELETSLGNGSGS
jgi:tetratricopeptide (TPR) repeat protein